MPADQDLSSASKEQIHYDLFLGDVTFVVDGADFSAHWGWVPILDFAASLWQVIDGLTEKPNAVFEFTESEALIEFSLNGDRVEVSSNYVDETATVDYSTLRHEAFLFAKKVIEELGFEHPLLKQNPHFAALEKKFHLRPRSE